MRVLKIGERPDRAGRRAQGVVEGCDLGLKHCSVPFDCARRCSAQGASLVFQSRRRAWHVNLAGRVGTREGGPLTRSA